jgi:hypothetical protein
VNRLVSRPCLYWSATSRTAEEPCRGSTDTRVSPTGPPAEVSRRGPQARACRVLDSAGNGGSSMVRVAVHDQRRSRDPVDSDRTGRADRLSVTWRLAGVQQPTNSHQHATIASPPAVLRPPRALTWNTVRPLRGQRRLPPRQARNPGSLNESSFAPASHQRHAISQCKSSCQSPPHRAPTRPPTLEPAPSTTDPHVTAPVTGSDTASDS